MKTKKQKVGKRSQFKPKAKTTRKAVLERIKLNAAGVDIGSEKIYVAIIDEPVMEFDTYTSGIKRAAEYILAKNSDSIAMEATGIYWFPIFEMFEEYGLECYVVNACHAKNVPGRKTDVLDSEWLRELHTFGLLSSSFIPNEMTRKLRTIVRLRDDHIEMGSTHIQHMHKSFDAMNIKLHNVISQTTGMSGLRVIKAILSGEQNPEKLANLCSQQILKNKRQDVIKSLEGNYKKEYLFALRQALDLWEFYQEKIVECDKEIEKILNEMGIGQSVPKNISKAKPINNHEPLIDDFHKKLLTITGGRDASQLTGLTDYTVMRLIAETGTDMSPWQTEKHFASWCNLAPWDKSSGKKKGTRKRKINNRTGQIFREVVPSVGKSKYLALGGFYRRIKSRHGAKVANKATARKIAVLYYRLMKYGFDYVEQGLEEYEKKYKEKMIQSITKKAKQYGMEMIKIDAA